MQRNEETRARSRRSIAACLWALIGALGLALVPHSLHAQAGNAAAPEDVGTGWGLGIGGAFGFFDPTDVDTYLENQIPDNAFVAEGISGMVLNFVPKVGVSYKPIKYLQAEMLFEIGLAPKVLDGAGVSETYNFMRMSPGLVLHALLPVGSRGSAIFVGGGALYHYMTFAEFSAGTIGGRVQGGFSLAVGSGGNAVEIFLAYDYAVAKTGQPIDGSSFGSKEMTLDYSGVQIGAIYYFGL